MNKKETGTYDLDQVEIGKRLKDLREQNHMKQSDLSKEWNCKRESISKYETGDRCITMDRLVDYVNTFGVPADYILFGNSLS